MISALFIPILIIGAMILVVVILSRNQGWEGGPPVPAAGTLADYLVDPNTKLPHVYVVGWACAQEYGNGPWVVLGHQTYEPKPRGTIKVKLIRSGSGFRVYGHEELKDGTWLPCR